MNSAFPSALIPEGSLNHLLIHWQAHPSPARHALLRTLAECAAGCLHAGGSLREVDLDRSYSDGTVVRFLPHQGSSPTTTHSIQLELLEANSFYGGKWTDGERLYFLLNFQRFMSVWNTGITRHWIRAFVSEVNQIQIHALGDWYETQLAAAPASGPNVITGTWTPCANQDPEGLFEEIRQTHRHCRRFLSRSRRAEVFETTLQGVPVIAKYFSLGTTRWKYRWRPSRARRAWAGARTLEHATLPCPRPLGFLEQYKNGLPVHAYFFTEPVPNVLPARTWIKPHLHRRPADERTAWRYGLRKQLLDLYERGILHADCKVHNLLLSKTHPRPSQWWWIDFEDIRAGRRPHVWEVYRNLVQLNGSIGRGISKKEREAFARGIQKYPFVSTALAIRMIERRTRIRLHRELTRSRSS